MVNNIYSKLDNVNRELKDSAHGELKAYVDYLDDNNAVIGIRRIGAKSVSPDGHCACLLPLGRALAHEQADEDGRDWVAHESELFSYNANGDELDCMTEEDDDLMTREEFAQHVKDNPSWSKEYGYTCYRDYLDQCQVDCITIQVYCD